MLHLGFLSFIIISLGEVGFRLRDQSHLCRLKAEEVGRAGRTHGKAPEAEEIMNVQVRGYLYVGCSFQI